MSSPKTLSSGTPNVTLSGLINAYGAVTTYQINGAPQTIYGAVVGHAPTHFTVHNTGTIFSGGSTPYDGGIVLNAAGTILNTGTIIAGTGIAIFGTTGKSELSNTGKIIGSLGIGVISLDFTEVTNSKYIYGNNYGLELLAGGSVQNLAKGTIVSGNDYAVASQETATISNAGTLSGADGGIILQSGGTVDNTGLILQTSANATFAAAVQLQAGGTVINAATGTIAAPYGNGIALENAGYISNYGTVTGNLGVKLADGGDITNQRTIQGTAFGIFNPTTAGYTNLYNAGLIAATSPSVMTYGAATFAAIAVDLYNSGIITNTGSIIGVGEGIIIGFSASYDIVNNSGLIEANGTVFTTPTEEFPAEGVLLFAGGTVTNNAGGTIIGYGVGVQSGLFLGQAGERARNSNVATSITNAGTILATDSTITFSNGGIQSSSGGVVLDQGGVLTNEASGYIAGHFGVYVSGGSSYISNGIYNYGSIVGVSAAGVYLGQNASLSNSGSIAGYNYGVLALAANQVTNQYGGVISAGFIGIVASNSYGQTATITNNGYVSSSYSGIVLTAGGLAVNNGVINASTAGIITSNAATIDNAGIIDSRTGVFLRGGGTVIDTGTISIASNGFDAIYFQSGFANRLVINAASDIIGTVNGGGGILELAAGGAPIGTVTAAERTQLGNFNSLQIDAGSVWDFTGALNFKSPAPLLNNGTIKLSTKDQLTINTALTGTGTVDLSKNPLTLNGSVASGQKISFTGTGETLDLGDPKKFSGKIEKFALGDTIDLTSISLSAITATHFVNGVLTLSEGSTKLEFTFANPASFGTDKFKLKAAGHGTIITLAAAAALLPVTHVTTLSPLTTLGS